jgi:periplasmic protein TonB
MAPFSKETVETATPSGESVSSHVGAPAKPASGHLRADAVSLEISVKVHGSRVTEVVRGIAPHTEPFEEQTSTMIVFPQGGVVRMSTTVNVGQMLVLTNLKSRQDAICRVVKVRTFTNLQGYVEVEFTHAQPGYWGAQFPGDRSTPQSTAAAPAPSAAPQAEANEKPTADISWAPAPPPAPKPFDTPAAKENQPAAAPPPTPVYVLPARSVSAFINIGSQEDVQASASAMVTTRAGAPSEITHETPAPSAPLVSASVSFPEALPAAPPATLSMAELRGDEEASAEDAETDAPVAVEEQQESSAAEASLSGGSHSTFGSLSGGASLESEAAASFEKSALSHPNWKLVGLSVAALLAVIAGGFFYSHSRSASHNAATVTNASAAAIAAASNAVQPDLSHTEQAAFPPAPQPVASNAARNHNVAAVSPPAPNRDSSSIPAHQPVVSQRPVVASASPNIMAQSLKARPTASQRADSTQAIDAPSVDVTPASDSPDAGAVPGIMDSTSAAPPPPEIKPEVALKVGGQVTEPVLLSKVLPVYPMMAKETGVAGDVVVKASIDKNGNVGRMEIVSGPTMLRQSALDALRRWKYKPSTLDGEPVAATIIVTLKFSR